MSSHATKSTDSRVSFALNVKSDRFPMGVATMYSFPFMIRVEDRIGDRIGDRIE